MDKTAFVIFLRFMMTALLCVVSATQLLAFDVETLRKEAEAGNAAAQRTLGEALILGTQGVSADAAAGAAYLERAVSQDDVVAKSLLGSMLLDGVFLEPRPGRGKMLLEEAAAAGDTAALARLGSAFLWGAILEQDIPRAADLLSQAADSGDIAAKRTLGEALIVGMISPKDVEKGLRLMEEAAATGDAKAQIALGKIFLYGQHGRSDLDRAAALFESAAASGNGAGLEEFGSYLMWVTRSKISAEDYLRRAGNLGRVTAWDTLAEGAMYGYLGEKMRRRFDEFATLARDAGSSRIDVLDAERHIWGITMEANVPAALAILEQAAKQGNQTALKALIALVRNGNDYNVRKKPAHARSYLERYGDILPPAEIDYYGFSIDAAQTRSGSGFDALTKRYNAMDLRLRMEYAKDLYAANPNFVIYMLQTDLNARGEYHGRPNGLATRKTINALAKACKKLPYARECKENVLDAGVISSLLFR